MTNQPDDLVERLGDEADLCRNDDANDIADLLDEAKAALVEADRKNEAMLHEWNAAEARAAKAEEALRECREQLASAMSAEEVRERAAEIAEHLNGWGVPPAPKLADHIAKVIRSMSLTK